jgi:hypothetical protein
MVRGYVGGASGMKVEQLEAHQGAVLRPVALAYRRAYRAAAERAPPDQELVAVAAAIPAPLPRRDGSHAVVEIIAAAINANSRWFWDGPDV